MEGGERQRSLLPAPVSAHSQSLSNSAGGSRLREPRKPGSGHAVPERL